MAEDFAPITSARRRRYVGAATESATLDIYPSTRESMHAMDEMFISMFLADPLLLLPV